MDTKCPKCQTSNPSDSKYCKECATPLPSPQDIEVTETIETPKEELTTGSTFAGRYQIIEELGKGGMGRVYKVLDKEINVKVALKLIKPEISAHNETIERFRNELKIARDISHKNVCRMYDLNKEEGSYFITMEYISGEDLKSFIRRSRQLAIGTAITIAKQVCEGLSEAHKSGVVHRDLKPSNIMIDKEGNARIMDFGIARSLKAKGLTGAGVMIGTPEYMSPEQVEAKETDQRTDIYSLGVILYEMVTGRRPFEGDTPLSIAVKHKTEPPPDPRDFNAQVPEDLSRMIHRCMEKDKENRYQGAGEVLSELMRIEEGIPTTEREVPQSEAITSKEITERIGWSRWKKLIPYLGSALLLILIIAAMIIFLPVHQESIDTIAVLPLENLSGDPGQEYLADGMTDALIAELGKIRTLNVISRQSVMQYKGSTKPMPEIAQELNVDGIVGGTVLRIGERIRITAQLVNARKDRHLWADGYERDLSDILSLQREVARAIAGEIRAKLTPEEEIQLASVSEVNPEALDLHLRGLHFFTDGTIEGLQRSIGFFQKAIEKDPAYARPHVGVAAYYWALGFYDALPPGEAFPKAKEAAEKALRMDENLAEAHVVLAYVKLMFDWDWAAAEEGFRRAIELNPNSARAHEGYATYLAIQERHDEALEEIERARRLDPLSLSTRNAHANILSMARYNDQAIEELNKILEMDPNYLMAHAWLAANYRAKGMFNEALAEIKKWSELSGEDDATIATVAQTYGYLGKRDEAKKLLDKVLELSEQRYVPPFDIAEIYLSLDQKDQAFEWFEKAYEARDHWLIFLKIHPVSERLHTDPRFKALLKKIGFE